MLERDLFPPLKKYFKELGYKVFPEVPLSKVNSVDFVAVKGNKQIAVEMKLVFIDLLIKQAIYDKCVFGLSYIAIPDSVKLDFSNQCWRKYSRCIENGIGILFVSKSGKIIEELKPIYTKPFEPFDLSGYVENDIDEGGLPYKGGSTGLQELKIVEEYVMANPDAEWKEIFENVPNRYSKPISMAGALRQSMDFNLGYFKKMIKEKGYVPRNHNGISLVPDGI